MASDSNRHEDGRVPTRERRRSFLRGTLGVWLAPGTLRWRGAARTTAGGHASRPDAGAGPSRTVAGGDPGASASAAVLTEAGGFFDVVRTPDQGYLLTGVREDADETGVGWAVKLDARRREAWSRTFLTEQHETSPDVGEFHEAFAFALPDGDGGYLLVGWAYDGFGIEKVAWVVAVDARGEERWRNEYTSEVATNAFHSTFADGLRTDDGGYLLAGRTVADEADDEWTGDGWLVKLDADGAVEWEQLHNTLDDARTGWPEDERHDAFEAVAPAERGGFLLVGEAHPDGPSESTPSAGWLVDVDPAGNKRWERTYRLTGEADNELLDVVPTADGGYRCGGVAGTDERLGLVGNLRVTTTVGAGWVLEVDADGDRRWQRAPGGDGVRGLVPLEDRTLLVGSRDDAAWARGIDDGGRLVAPSHVDGAREGRYSAGVPTADGPLLVGWRRPRADGPVHGLSTTLGAEHVLEVTKDDEGKAAFLLETTGEVRRGRDSEAVVEGSSALDHVGSGGTDRLRFTGDVSTFVMKGDATVRLDGREVDPDALGAGDGPAAADGDLPNTLTVESGGRDAGNYAVTVDGAVRRGEGSEAAVRGRSAVDWVGPTGGTDALRFSGAIRTFLLKGHARVSVNGERVDPNALGE